MPAVVAELGFLTNEDEAARLVTNEVLDELVVGLVAGLRDYDEWLEERDFPRADEL
jgi:N-acetylmuramoyl-L-alanine amidase